MPFNSFNNRQDLSLALSSHIAQKLQEALENKGRASIAFSGGSTPKKLFNELSNMDIAWNNVDVTLVDERWVSDSDNRSNAKLVQDNFLKSKAKEANFVPLYDARISYDEISSNEYLFAGLLPFNVVILGMGTDGHTASFFPGGNKLDAAVDRKTKNILIDMKAAGAGEPRVTFTLPALVAAEELILHIEGDAKKEVFEEAQKDGDVDLLPIRHVLNARADLNIYWAP